MSTENTTTAAPLGPFPPLAPHARVAGMAPPRLSPHKRGSQQNVRPQPPADDAMLDDLLPRDHFLGHLHLEKRRADRSKAPLSLVIYRMAKASSAEDASSLAGLLLSNKRETDLVGQIGDGVLAVICTDTGDAGAHRFIDKIEKAAGDLHYSVECATYPDHLFDGLAAAPSSVRSRSPLLSHMRASTREVYWLKRPIDILGALVALVLFAPLMLATALAVKLSSRGPMIFRQTRLGKDGVPFVFYKFRSMVTNGDDRIHREYMKSLIQGENDKVNQQAAGDAAPVYKIKADPRITSVGRFIRRTSLDELPQLFNVLKGDMSLVGPRPPVPYEAENYQSWHLRRVLDVKPGITGLWQVEGRSKVTFDEMVRLDLGYIRGCSLSLDMRIIVKTFLVVLRCDGAT